METLKIEKNLKAFLEQEGALDQFIKNAIDMSPVGKWDNVQINAIGEPFYWGKAPEGCEFWAALDTKFRKSNITYYEIIDESLKPIVEHIKAQPETEKMGNAILVFSQQIKGEDVARWRNVSKREKRQKITDIKRTTGSERRKLLTSQCLNRLSFMTTN